MQPTGMYFLERDSLHKIQRADVRYNRAHPTPSVSKHVLLVHHDVSALVTRVTLSLGCIAEEHVLAKTSVHRCVEKHRPMRHLATSPKRLHPKPETIRFTEREVGSSLAVASGTRRSFIRGDRRNALLRLIACSSCLILSVFCVSMSIQSYYLTLY